MTGMCQCGCGSSAGVWPKTYGRLGVKKGDPKKFINGHQWKRDWYNLYAVDSVTGCWNWLGSKTGGYGRVAHRLAYVMFFEKAKGQKPKGFDLDHVCRNRGCVNPDHLEAVTRKVNCRRGNSTKLTAQSVSGIRTFLAKGESSAEVAVRFGVTPGRIRTIARGEAWADV